VTKKQRKSVIQTHHVRYKGVPRFVGDSIEEWKEIVIKGEHKILWETQCRKRFSCGFIRSMEFELKRARLVAVNLDEPSRLKKKC